MELLKKLKLLIMSNSKLMNIYYIIALILLTLVLLKSNSYSQQVLELCETDITKVYNLLTPDSVKSVDIFPYASYQLDDKTVYVTYTGIGTYILTAQFTNGICEVDDKYVIRVVECTNTVIWVPNAISPNNDCNFDNSIYRGCSKEFGAYGININDYSLDIYDRWGLLIFHSNDITDRWTGKLKNGSEVYISDVYTYVIKYKDNKKQFKQLIGKVTLIL